MSKVQNTVFISYRRTNVYMARAIYQHLSAEGFEVFFDYESIKVGDFSQIILRSIESHAHFLPLLTPSALERCTDPNDWVRREIEHAMQHQRNIIPLTMEGFDFSDINKYLPHIADTFGKYNAVRIPADYFDAAMGKLVGYLNQPLDTVMRPATPKIERYKQEQKQAVAAQPAVTKRQMTAEEWFEKGLQVQKSEKVDLVEVIRYYTEAIRLKPDYADAYNNRGLAYKDQGDYAAAIRDYTEAIRLKPDYAMAYNNRGFTYTKQNNLTLAISDWEAALRIAPNDALTKKNLDIARRQLKNGG